MSTPIHESGLSPEPAFPGRPAASAQDRCPHAGPNPPATSPLPPRWLPTPERLATASHRILPDFLILGAMKAGTTSLYDMFRRHPNFIPAFRKEVHFFDLPYQWDRGLNYYRAFFPTRIRRLLASTRAGTRVLTGEASPYYLYHPHVSARVAASLPNGRFIILLRDPIIRAFSHHQHSIREGWDDRPFAQAVREELDHLGERHRAIEADPALFICEHQQREYLHRGHYAEQLERWFIHIPRHRFLILRAESFFLDSADTFRRACAFLGLKAQPKPPARRSNRGRYVESIDHDTEVLLRDHFRPLNRRLDDLLGERFSEDWR